MALQVRRHAEFNFVAICYGHVVKNHSLKMSSEASNSTEIKHSGIPKAIFVVSIKALQKNTIDKLIKVVYKVLKSGLP